jgi:hypothetical protein
MLVNTKTFIHSFWIEWRKFFVFIANSDLCIMQWFSTVLNTRHTIFEIKIGDTSTCKRSKWWKYCFFHTFCISHGEKANRRITRKKDTNWTKADDGGPVVCNITIFCKYNLWWLMSQASTVPPLNRITLDRQKSDNNNWMFHLTNV